MLHCYRDWLIALRRLLPYPFTQIDVSDLGLLGHDLRHETLFSRTAFTRSRVISILSWASVVQDLSILNSAGLLIEFEIKSQ